MIPLLSDILISTLVPLSKFLNLALLRTPFPVFCIPDPVHECASSIHNLFYFFSRLPYLTSSYGLKFFTTYRRRTYMIKWRTVNSCETLTLLECKDGSWHIGSVQEHKHRRHQYYQGQKQAGLFLLRNLLDMPHHIPPARYHGDRPEKFNESIRNKQNSGLINVNVVQLVSVRIPCKQKRRQR